MLQRNDIIEIVLLPQHAGKAAIRLNLFAERCQELILGEGIDVAF